METVTRYLPAVALAAVFATLSFFNPVYALTLLACVLVRWGET